MTTTTTTTTTTARAAREWLLDHHHDLDAAARRRIELAAGYMGDGLADDEIAELDALNHLDDCVNAHTGFTLASIADEVHPYATPAHEWTDRCRELAEDCGLITDAGAAGNPLLAFVDWNAWADAVRVDAYEFEVDGFTFIVG